MTTNVSYVYLHWSETAKIEIEVRQRLISTVITGMALPMVSNAVTPLMQLEMHIIVMHFNVVLIMLYHAPKYLIYYKCLVRHLVEQMRIVLMM